jgi:hypothetical protein
MAIMTIVTMMIVMAMDADAYADGTNINTDDGGIGDASTQQGQGKNRSNKGFHSSSLSRDANSASFAGLGVDSNVAITESRELIFRSKSYNLAICRLLRRFGDSRPCLLGCITDRRAALIRGLPFRKTIPEHIGGVSRQGYRGILRAI